MKNENDIRTPSNPAGKPLKIFVLVATSPAADEQELTTFARALAEEAVIELRKGRDVQWEYHLGETYHLENTSTHRADDFLREAFLRMVQSSCDLVFVITDVPVISESKFMVPGLAAPESQVAVISTRKLLTVPAGEQVRKLDDPIVKHNASLLFLHLLGHILRLKHEEEGVMAPYNFDEERKEKFQFSEAELISLEEAAGKLTVREIPVESELSTFRVHMKALTSNPADIFRIAWRSKAILLPLSLTKLTTAAIAPAILMFFTDEFWWVGIHRDPVYIWSAAIVAILGATFYIPFSQDLLFPHREKRVLTSNIATANLGMFFSIFFMVVGLFLLVTLSILILEIWLFPPEMIIKWFDSFNFTVSWYDHFKIAVVVGTLGTLTGALGSGFHGRELIRAVSFFLKKP